MESSMSGMEIEEVIVVVRQYGRFSWFRSDRELWVLDLNKWKRDFLEGGFEVPESSPSERFGIPIVNEVTIDEFITAMQQFRVSKDDLAEDLVRRLPAASSSWDVNELFPIMFVDADRRHVCAFYSQGIRMERYVPDGWTSEFEDFLTKYPEEQFPVAEKFWVLDGFDALQELNRRGQELNQQKH